VELVTSPGGVVHLEARTNLEARFLHLELNT